MKKFISIIAIAVLVFLTGTSAVHATTPYVESGIEDGSWNSCQADGIFWWDGTAWLPVMWLYYQTPEPCSSHPIWAWLNNPPTEAGTVVGETARYKRFSCESSACAYENGLPLITEQQNNPEKDGCTVSGSLQWNDGEQKWEAKVIYYNSSPPPCDIHPSVGYAESIRIPNRPGDFAWETVEWQAFECITGCEEYPVVLPYPLPDFPSNEYISGSLIYTSYWGWLRLILTYNGAPEPCLEHPVYSYLWSLTKPTTPGAEFEIRNTEYYSVLDGCDNGLSVIFQQKDDSNKGNCDISGSLQWNPFGYWEAKVVYYNATPVPCSGHSAEIHARTVAVPDRDGESDWESIEWQLFGCECIGN